MRSILGTVLLATSGLVAGCGGQSSSSLFTGPSSPPLQVAPPPGGIAVAAHPSCGRPSRVYSVGRRTILFASVGGQLGEALWAIDVEGGRKRRITFTPRCEDTGPAWSPDGERIAFASDRAPAPPGNTDIYVMDASGRQYRDVTPDREADSDPAWSPDGTKIAYLREPLGGGEVKDGVIEAIRCGAVRAKIEVVNVKSGRTQVVGRVGSCDGERPSWSRDGKQLLVWSGNESLVLLNADGKGSRRLLRHGFYVDAVFSPDGRHIAATCSPRDELELDTDICLLRSDGSHLRVLTSSSSITWNFDPAWSPDSRRIIFARCNRGARQDIWVISANGRAQHRLTQGRPLFAGCGDELDSAPSWRPDR